MQEQKTTGLWQNRSQRPWTWPSLSRQVLHLWTVGLRRRARGYSKPQVGRLSVQGNLTQKEVPTQRRVLKDGKRMLCRMSVQGNLSHQDTKDIQETQELQEIQKTRKPRENFGPHHYHISPDCVPHRNKVCSIVRQTYGRSPTDDLNDLDVNTAIWGIFMTVTLHAAVHLGQDFSGNLRYTKNQPLKSVRHLFQTTDRLITDPSRNYRTVHDWLEAAYVERNNSVVWKGCSNCEFPKSTSFPIQCPVWEASVIIQSKPGKTESNCFWKHIISTKIWIESTGSQWSSSGQISQDSQHCEFSTGFKKWWRNSCVNESKWKEGSSSCRCTMTLYGENEETRRIVWRILSKLQNTLEDSRKDVGHFWGLDARRNGVEPILTNRTENGTDLLKAWSSTLLKADILYFVPSVLWKDENLEAKEKERRQFTSTEVVKPLGWFFAQSFLSIYGAVADLHKELARNSPSAGKPAENKNLKSMVVPTQFPDANTISPTVASVQGDLLRECGQRFAELPENQKLSKLC